MNFEKKALKKEDITCMRWKTFMITMYICDVKMPTHAMLWFAFICVELYTNIIASKGAGVENTVSKFVTDGRLVV